MEPRRRSHRFPWGVASGEPTSTSLVLWTRVDAVDAPVVTWSVLADGVGAGGGRGETSQVRSGEVRADGDGVVRVEVTGLSPGLRHHYWFRVEEDDADSAIGSATTLDPDAASIRLGVACCSRLASGSFDAYDGLRRAAPDLVVHLGDYIYEDGGGRHDDEDAPPPDPPHTCRTRGDYERRYAQYRSERPLRQLHAAAPWVLTPDDHEVTDDAVPPPSRWRPWQRRRRRRRGDATVDPERLAAALAARDRWMPQEPHGNGPTSHDRIVPLGRLGELVLVDTRLGGRQPQAGEGPTPVARREGRRSLLSDAQWQWMEDVVAHHRDGWLLLASQVQVSPLRLGWLPTSRPPFVRPVVNPDQWDGYPADRGRLIELLDRYGLQRVVLLSGDLHARFVTSTARSGGGVLVEFTTPSVSAPSFASLIARRLPLPRSWGAWRVVARWFRIANPHIVEMDLEQHGTTVLDVTADAVTVTALDTAGDPVARHVLT